MTESTFSTEGPKCPHCGRQFTADDAAYYQPAYVKDECDECGKTFSVDVHYEVSWRCEAIETEDAQSTAGSR